MKKQLLLVALFCLSAIAFGQKKEIKKAERALNSGNAAEAISLIGQAESLLGSADDEMKTSFYIIKGNAYLAEAGTVDYEKLKIAADAFKMAEKLSPKGSNAQDLSIGKQNLRVALVNSAIDDQKSKNFNRATDKLYLSYEVHKDTLDLYYAAESAINAKSFDKALDYYNKLLDMGYTGIKQEWVAVELESGNEVVFASEADRNTNMLTGKYTNPTERMSESVRGDMLQKLTRIYVSRKENEKALALMKEAREANPDDVGLIRAEADMAYSMGDMEKYSSLMKEVIAADPNNPELYYNLGVGSANKGDKETAIEYYKKALELDPAYTNAKINIAATLLSEETAMVEEMNNLGTSSADNARYDELKEMRNQLYKDAIPYLKGAVQDRPKNVEWLRTLVNIYSQLGMDSEEKEARAKLEALESGGQ